MLGYKFERKPKKKIVTHATNDKWNVIYLNTL